ncbi:MAG TPA: hypothetical protein VFX74_00630 [Candidatus Limnocylindria bacterium]|nr:hypothetical protein [Candidatus Limnocylindria bacterium]
MAHLSALWPWLTLAALGAFHGLNPAMGWLFAVALGLQERRLRAVTAALGPIALGHTLAIAIAAIAVGVLGLVIPQRLLLALGGSALLSFAAYKVLTRFRHPRWVGMRVSPRELVLWSFLMASAHGAGLMLVPVLVALRGEGMASVLADAGHGGHMRHAMPAAGNALGPAVAAVGLHAAAMLAVAGLIAVVVYEKLGVEVLRRAWVNLDFIWVGALVVTGSIALGLSVWPMLPT